MNKLVVLTQQMFSFPDLNPFLREEHLTQLILNQGLVEGIQLATLLKNGFRSCVDGRSTKAIIGSFGGNMGDFVKALQALENSTGVFLNSLEVHTIFEWLLSATGSPFYMHTDTHARYNVIKELLVSSRYTGFIPTATTFEDWLWAGPQGKNHHEVVKNHSVMLHALTKASCVGCGHLSRMIKHPNQYGVRQDLVIWAIQAFFAVMWTGTQEQKALLTYKILEHDHDERLVLQVFVDGNINTRTVFPLIRPNKDGTQMFVQHPQVEAAIDENVASQIAQAPVVVSMGTFEREGYLQQIQALEGAYSTETVSQLALTLPVVAVHFRPDWYRLAQ